MTKQSICVYCGSRFGTRKTYETAASDMGRAIADNGWRLVYGAGDVGLMGTVARSAQAHGAETFGVIPEHLLRMEVGKRDLTSFVVTETMHERKKVLLLNADAVVVMPGGAGSLDEFFEVLTWRQLGLHAKPIVLLDIDGYWGPLRALLDHVVDYGFADASLLDFVQSGSSVAEVTGILRRALSRATLDPE